MYSQPGSRRGGRRGRDQTPSAAASLRNYLDGARATPAVDEEQFRLVTSFNDIFVSIASAILLFAVGWIGQSIGQALGLDVVDPATGPEPARARRRRRDRLGPGPVLHRQAAHGAALDHAAAGVRRRRVRDGRR